MWEKDLSEVLLLQGHAQIWTMQSYCIEPFEHQQQYIPHANMRVPEVVTFIIVLLLGGFQGTDLYRYMDECTRIRDAGLLYMYINTSHSSISKCY